jgi:5'-3' exonuclease
MHLQSLSNKTVVVDTSIYLYKFAAENAIAENMYLLISIFKKYKIRPIFIFDGKPPDEKKDLLIQRRNDKKEAQQK